MKFKDYMDEAGLTAKEAARKFDVSLSTVRKWRQGVRSPRHQMKKQIKQITHGKVSFDDWE